MKWLIGILIVAVITAPLIYGKVMKQKEQELGFNKMLSVNTYEGTINGKYFFKIVLVRKGDSLNGTLTNTFKKKNEVFGSIDGDDLFVLTEYEDGQKVGVLEGKISTGGEIKGTWSTTDGKKWFPFFLVKAAN